jgi:hypothetical protein
MEVAEDVVVLDKTTDIVAFLTVTVDALTTTGGFVTVVTVGTLTTTGGFVTVAAGVVAVALLVLGAVVDEVAVALPLLDVAPGVNTVALLLLGGAVGEVAVALLVLPAPAEDVNELELLLLLLEPGGVTPKVGLAWEGGAIDKTKLPTKPIYRGIWVNFNIDKNLLLVQFKFFK